MNVEHTVEIVSLLVVAGCVRLWLVVYTCHWFIRVTKS